MLVGVKVLPRKEVVDTQGRTIQKVLKDHGKNVGSCSVGKYIELEIDAINKEEALKKAKEIAEFLLHNPLTENFSLELIED